jgi:hypothetical protein
MPTAVRQGAKTDANPTKALRKNIINVDKLPGILEGFTNKVCVSAI